MIERQSVGARQSEVTILFGLMKSKSCSGSPEERLRRRLHYCGTCKTMGRLYGQKTRLFLNNDAVFLAELLSDLAGAGTSVEDWGPAYRSYNCLSLPPGEQDMPLPLKYAATAAVVMADFKIADRITDSGRIPWAFARRVFSKAFSHATRALARWQFPLDELRKCSRIQDERELAALNSTPASPDQMLDYLAEPTATASGLFFEHGARLVGAGTIGPQMHSLGFKFGRVIYLLDAIEDYESDLKAGQFNALAVAFRTGNARLSRAHRDNAHRVLLDAADEIEADLQRLPIPLERSRAFTSRLRANLSARLGVNLPVITAAPAQAVAEATSRAGHRACFHLPLMSKRGLANRYATALSIGRSMREQHALRCRLGNAERYLASRIQAPFVFASAAMVGFLFPHQAVTAASYRECMGMAANLILIGGLLRSVLAAPWHFSPAGSGPPPGSVPPYRGPGGPPGGPSGGAAPVGEPAPPPKRGSSCAICCCDSCDGCDCCCECGECCNCCDCG
jgi:hypothetical protein